MNTRLVIYTDNNFIYGAANLIYTFNKYNSWYAFEIYVIDNNISTEYKNILNQIYSKLVFIKLESFNLLNNTNIHNNSTTKAKVFQYKLNIFQLRNYNYLYVDSDCIFQNDIHQLFNSNYMFAATPIKYYNLKNNSNSNNFIQAGVMFINQQLLLNTIESEIYYVFKKYLNKFKLNNMSDQFVLNKWLSEYNRINDVTHLDIIYNCNRLNYKKFKKEIIILHLWGENKPWKNFNFQNTKKINLKNFNFNSIWIKEFLNIKHLFNTIL